MQCEDCGKEIVGQPMEIFGATCCQKCGAKQDALWESQDSADDAEWDDNN